MTAAFAPGSISLRVYPADLSPADVVADIRTQGRLAEAGGFDGCMTSEHHGGFPNYLPNPLLAATWLLDATERIWAGPCPMVLPLRPVTQVVEDLAWTHHRFPGRVGVGVCAGALPVDFEMAGVPFGEMFPRYRAALGELAAALGGKAEGPLAAEPGVAALAPGEIPLVAAVQADKTAAPGGRPRRGRAVRLVADRGAHAGAVRRLRGRRRQRPPDPDPPGVDRPATDRQHGRADGPLPRVRAAAARWRRGARTTRSSPGRTARRSPGSSTT